MDFIGNETLGVTFLALSAFQTFLMYYLWGFPFDKEKLESTAPKWLMYVHRASGYLYLVIYLYFMWQMVPRMWNYQIELPARTVAHLVIGLSIGAVLFTKIMIVLFFKHLESTLIPAMGTYLFIATILLMGLALPNAFRETYLSKKALKEFVLDDSRIKLVKKQLPEIGLDDEERVSFLASKEGLLSGRDVLTNKCTQCHDMRTVLARPRTPQNWRQTVSRMAERSIVVNEITEEEQWAVTAYLMSISSTLQRSLELKKDIDDVNTSSMSAVKMATSKDSTVTYNANAARELFQNRCALCHDPTRVERYSLNSRGDVETLVTRMVNNGLYGTEEEFAQIIQYITDTYVKE